MQLGTAPCTAECSWVEWTILPPQWDTHGTIPNYQAVQFANSAENFPVFFSLPALFIYFCLIAVIFYSFLQAVSALCRVRQTPDQGICSRKSREAAKGVERQPLAGSSELLNLLKCPNRCVSSWKDELVLCFCHPACIPFPLF